MGTLPNQPIDGFFLIAAEGIVTLGPAYGTVRVAGMTMEEAAREIIKRLQGVLMNPDVSVELAKSAGTAPVSGDYLVEPDGTINLGQYGTLEVTGKTIAEATSALEKHLTKYFDAPEVAVSVRQFNSKVFYVITEGVGAGTGDNIRRVPITGNETVLDALTVVNGLSPVSSKKIWISRPSASNPEKGTVLPVDYAAITRRGATATNYQILPGDRIFIAEDPLLARTNEFSKQTAQLEKVLGLIGLGTSVPWKFHPAALGRKFSGCHGHAGVAMQRFSRGDMPTAGVGMAPNAYIRLRCRLAELRDAGHRRRVAAVGTGFHRRLDVPPVTRQRVAQR